MMDTTFGGEDEFNVARADSATTAHLRPQSQAQPPARPQSQNRLPAAPRPLFKQPTHQRLDRTPPPGTDSAGANNARGGGLQQPIPQALVSRSSVSTILVSPRQKGNPVLTSLKSMPWEYSDIVADYGLGLTTCALFLSLKYHRLHPEYIYNRIRNLQGRYSLRILLTMADIPNHEEALRELAKTSLVNNVTLVLTWSAAEAARYLELYKSYEHVSNFASIKGSQASTYAERLVEFVTVPRSVNKADAVALVSTFGSLRSAVNADPEQVGIISGWGEKKVKAWCKAVEEPFRVRKAARRRAGDKAKGQDRETSLLQTSEDVDADEGGGARLRSSVLDTAVPLGRVALRDMPSATTVPKSRPWVQNSIAGKEAEPIEDDEEEAMLMVAMEASKTAQEKKQRQQQQSRQVQALRSAPASREEPLSDGVAAALAKLREKT